MPPLHTQAKHTSYGLLMYRTSNGFLEVFLAHDGGPFFRKKDTGGWGIPKGGAHEHETEPLEAAKREFTEETGITPCEPYIPLGAIKYRGGKTVHAWAFQYHHNDTPHITSNTYQIEWPPKTGRMQTYPEIDKAQFFTVGEARSKMLTAQLPFIERLENSLNQ